MRITHRLSWSLSIVSLFVALLFFGASMSAQAATWTVDASAVASCADPDFTCVTLQDAINAASAGDTILVHSGSYAETVSISKALTITGTANLVEDNPHITGAIAITSSDVAVSGLTITNPNGLYGILINNVSNVSITGNLITGIGTALANGSAQGILFQGTTGTAASAIVISGNTITDIGSLDLAGPNLGNGTSAKGIYIGDTGSTGTITGLQIANNHISHVYAETDVFPAGRGAYGILINFGGATEATITNNTISMLEGLWVHGIGLERNTPNTVLTGNNFGTLTDHKTPSDAFAVFFESNASAGSVVIDGNTYGGVNAVAVNAAWAGLGGNPFVSLDGSSYIYGINAFSTISAAVAAVAPGGTVTVAAGTYNEEVVITTDDIHVVGAGVDATILKGPKTGSANTLFINAHNTVVEGMTITRDGNTTTDWDTNAKNQGVSIGQTKTGNILRFVKVTGNRNGVYINNAQGNTLTDVTITDNRTGIQFANDISNTTVTHSTITDNWTLGVLFNFVSGQPTVGSNVKINDNTISGNWYGDISSRSQTAFDVSRNYFGTATISTSTATSSEPGYSALVPVAFGGAATNPGGAPILSGFGVDMLVYTPWYVDATRTTVGSLTVDNGNGTVSATLGTQVAQTTSTPSGAVDIEIPALTTVTGPDTWDGTLMLPTVVSTPVAPIADSGFTASAVLSVEVGASGVELIFDQPVRLFFAGQAANEVGWSRNGTFTKITATCDSLTAPTLAAGADCRIASGSDLVVWTKHFTTFTTYTQTAVAPAASTGGGNGAPVGTIGGGGSGTGGSVVPSVGVAALPTPSAGSVGGEVLGAETHKFTVNLGYGSRGDDVVALHQILIDLGYLRIARPTGWFGPLTKAAVQQYQKSKGIVQTGFVGALTRAELNGAE